MGSVAYGLGQIGSSLAQAKELQRQEQIEKIKLALEQQKVGIEQGQLGVSQKYSDINAKRFGLEEQQANRPTYKGFTMVGGKMVALLQDPNGSLRVQTFDTLPAGDPFAAAVMKAIDGITDPKIKQDAQNEAGMYLSQGDTKGAFGAVKSRIDKAQSDEEAEKKEKTRHQEHEEDVTESEKFRRSQAAIQRDFMRTMVDYRLQEKAKQMNPQERKLYDLTKQVQPKVDQLKKVIEDNKLTEEGGIGAALNAQYQFRGKYKAGIPPDKVRSDLIKSAAALQVMGAAPWMQIGRGRYMFETITQHLPSPTDTPALLYDKANFLQGIVDEAKESLSGYQIPEGTGAGAPPPGAVIHDFSQQ